LTFARAVRKVSTSDNLGNRGLVLRQPRVLTGFGRFLLTLFVVSAMSTADINGLAIPQESVGLEFAPAEPLSKHSSPLSPSSFIEELEEEFDEDDDSPLPMAALCERIEILAALAAGAAWMPHLQRVASRLATGPPILTL